MKAVLLSIHPKYCHLIAKGEKTLEVRKSKPKLDLPFKCYIYCTASDKSLGLISGNGITDLIACINWKTAIPVGGEICNGKVFGEFVCNKITTIFYGCEIMYGIDYPNKHAKQLEDDSCLSLKELKHYANAKDVYGWNISDLKIYDTPKELWELYKPGFEAMEDLDCDDLCGYCHRTDYGSKAFGVTPNGYYSCEGAWCGEAYESYLEDNFALERPPQSWYYVEEL